MPSKGAYFRIVEARFLQRPLPDADHRISTGVEDSSSQFLWGYIGGARQRAACACFWVFCDGRKEAKYSDGPSGKRQNCGNPLVLCAASIGWEAKEAIFKIKPFPLHTE
ncbi:hypothetical protein WJ01_07515 [Burkholderia vietnamiensis]|nr:hypothetical protein WJ01_07515 [Burkholderia vietnamiensis]